VGRLYFSNSLDMICGMEISESRRKRFIFSKAYYKRKSVIFVLEKNENIKNIEDLIGKNITGDRDSYTEKIMLEQGLLDKIRIKQTKNKSESLDLLKAEKYIAVIAPKAVGTYLAKQKGMQVRVIEIGDPGINVGLAFRKEDIMLKNEVDKILSKLLNDGTIELLKKNGIYNKGYPIFLIIIHIKKCSPSKSEVKNLY